MLKPSNLRKKRIRSHGSVCYAATYTNHYWKSKADKLLARFPNYI